MGIGLPGRSARICTSGCFGSWSCISPVTAMMGVIGFVVVIPLADRPRHLQNCLASLLTLCQRFGYGGVSQHAYDKISVLIADDSKAPENIRQHLELVADFKQQGLKTFYFGQAEQLQQLDRLSQQQRHALCRVVGSNWRTAFYHKGASITRNLAYLKLAELAADRPPPAVLVHGQRSGIPGQHW